MNKHGCDANRDQPFRIQMRRSQVTAATTQKLAWSNEMLVPGVGVAMVHSSDFLKQVSRTNQQEFSRARVCQQNVTLFNTDRLAKHKHHTNPPTFVQNANGISTRGDWMVLLLRIASWRGQLTNRVCKARRSPVFPSHPFAITLWILMSTYQHPRNRINRRHPSGRACRVTAVFGTHKTA